MERDEMTTLDKLQYDYNSFLKDYFSESLMEEVKNVNNFLKCIAALHPNFTLDEVIKFASLFKRLPDQKEFYDSI